ncbi:MAG: B12-binding domain-containing radical SAM protein [Chitinispirillaceae bacterium]
MKILLIYPRFPDTYWSYKHALKFVGKRAVLPPLGLLTVAAMLPPHYELRLIDTNVQRLTNRDLAWADAAFISGMSVQQISARKIIDRCKKANLPVIAGGPLFASNPESFTSVDHFVLNEAELTLPAFLEDFSRGAARRIYSSDQFADMQQTPTPRWELLKLKQYANMSIQFSRGCPFQCDFCNVTALLGHRVRTKSSRQIIDELDALYELGWRDDVFFVDDNFIGNKSLLKNDLLPALINWRKDKQDIQFYTEASINLADDEELIKLMVDAGFSKVFIGIETPEEESLTECGKRQNNKRNLVENVRFIQRSGLEVQAGFIVGFDHDQSTIFQKQIDFIQQSGIVTAMVGMLQAIPGTRLFERMKLEGRLCGDFSGDNVDGSTNIIPRMGSEVLRDGYAYILQTIYSPKVYYERIRNFLGEYNPPCRPQRLQFSHLIAFVRSLFQLGILSNTRSHYWKLLLWTRGKGSGNFRNVVSLSILGYHYRKISMYHVRKPYRKAERDHHL